ncbi:UNVERIFIED_ORG: hypothetical protein DFS12_102569 [Chitinophaga ginsengisegetis]
MLLLSPRSFVTPAPGFGAFIFASRRNGLLLAAAVIVAVIKMMVFKHFPVYRFYVRYRFLYGNGPAEQELQPLAHRIF